MQSRMDKYYAKQSSDGNGKEHLDDLEKTTTLKRIDKNQVLYKEVSSKELEDFDLNSNVSVIGEGNNVDIDKIREMLDRKYRELPKNKPLNKTEPEIGKINLDETREYDLNSILEQAHKEKEINYEEDRLKKLRNTQYDILKDLDILKKDDEEIEEEDIEKAKPVNKEKEEKKLQELIDTITAKELIKQEDFDELDPLDLLSDLRGNDENTKVLGALSDELLIDEETIKGSKEPTKEIEVPELEEEKPLEIKPIDVDMDFTRDVKMPAKEEIQDLTKLQNINFTQSDFDDFNDLKEDMHFTKIVIRILIIVIIIVFLVGGLILANKLLGLGLF